VLAVLQIRVEAHSGRRRSSRAAIGNRVLSQLGHCPLLFGELKPGLRHIGQNLAPALRRDRALGGAHRPSGAFGLEGLKASASRQKIPGSQPAA
jgi:hypothetical protein